MSLINDCKNSLLTFYSRFIVFWFLSLIQVLSWMPWKVSWMPYKNSWSPYKISWMPYKSQTWMPYKFSWMPYKISWMPYKSNRDQKCSVCGLSCLLSTCIPPFHGIAETRKKICMENLATMVRSCNENFVWRVWNHIWLLDMVAKKGQHGNLTHVQRTLELSFY